MIAEVNGWPVAHRPYPPPDAPWIMYQEWHDLLFAHWPVSVDVVRALIPPSVRLDTHGGAAWIGITPFRVVGARARLTPAIPFVSDFPELNVRTYVTVDDKPGVWFFSLDAGNRLAVEGARTLFHLPYFEAETRVETDGPWVFYHSSRLDERGTPGAFDAVYRPIGEVFEAEKGTLEYFLAERYCLYTVDDAGSLYRCDIHHRPWPLQPAEAEITLNTMPAADGLTLPDLPPRLHFARRQRTIVWAPERTACGLRAAA